MDDYIFLIIAIVISIFAAIKQNKKKEVENPLIKKAEKSRNFFLDQLLGENFLDEPDEKAKLPDWGTPVAKKEPLVVAPLVSPAKTGHQAFESHLPERKKKNIQMTVKQQVPEESETSEDDDMPGYLEDFSLRKAFVYSEIMTPKYLTETGSLN